MSVSLTEQPTLTLGAESRAQLRALWLGELAPGERTRMEVSSPLSPAVGPWEIHDLLTEFSSGTRPCTSCCTQCSGSCCNASC